MYQHYNYNNNNKHRHRQSQNTVNILNMHVFQAVPAISKDRISRCINNEDYSC